jgi:hypothetical protein
MVMTKGILDLACDKLSNAAGDIKYLMWLSCGDKTENRKADVAAEAYHIIEEALVKIKEINERYKKEF